MERTCHCIGVYHICDRVLHVTLKSTTPKLLTRTNCSELAQEVDAAIDVELDKLLAIDDMERRNAKRTHGLYARLLEANTWLDMIQRCVESDDAVIRLPAGVSVALYDAHIL